METLNKCQFLEDTYVVMRVCGRLVGLIQCFLKHFLIVSGYLSDFSWSYSDAKYFPDPHIVGGAFCTG
ncbi:hypothetical protein PROAA_1280008 [Candidatus Propionivibrio aalborgensis]|jgi:hypothetical protein|uniref:Uncharacterized protein n=1 Tax=Candidatus Propionivibrio aalborgensis TaxID=1860101 RepID=A0A1A8XI78_9RHOO|nr:hypothetical protein PROAA_1280008 [Candidatus Propionivibrio aalborgensis]